MARSDRTDPDAPKYGALLSVKDALNQGHLEEELRSNERNFQLITRDYTASEKLIQKQIEMDPKDAQITKAVRQLNGGKSYEEIASNFEKLLGKRNN
jgi:hypothetical protein